MQFETLKSSKRKYFLYALVVGVALLLPLVLTFSKAKYKMTESINIVEGTIKNYSPSDINLVAIKLQNENGEYDSSDTIPSEDYVLNETKSYCTIPDGSDSFIKDSSIVINYHDGVISLDNVTKKNTKCYLSFDLKTKTIEEILATKTISTRTEFSATLTTDTTGTIFTAEDNYGTSYYYAGNPTDNWVKFAGFYWRIIRINGDGTIRMIYQGNSANVTGEGTQIGTSKFNSGYNDNMYMGYMYTSGQIHGAGTNSTIKGVLDTWYTSYLASYASYIATGAGATFCNDRQPSTTTSSINNSGGTGTTTTYYAALFRLEFNKNPSLRCTNSSDRFNTNIGLITADEISYAGGVYFGVNTNFYLYTGQFYWTITPLKFINGYAYVFRMDDDGNFTNRSCNSVRGVRPVINLRADTTFIYGGTGTAENPYVVL